jgi:hypothetical protein
VVQALAEALTEHCVFTSGGVWADRRAAGVADIDERRNRGIGEGGIWRKGGRQGWPAQGSHGLGGGQRPTRHSRQR